MNQFVLMFLMYLRQEEDATTTMIVNKSSFVHTCYQKRFLRSLSRFEQRLCSRRLPGPSLLSTKQSPWRQMFHSECDQAMITCTGFCRTSFLYILIRFAPLFDYNTLFMGDTIVGKNPAKGRKRKIRAEDALGLMLMWTRTRGGI